MALEPTLSQGLIQTGIYRHYKNKLYRVLGEGKHTETEEPLVFYQSLYDDFKLWARPKQMWYEKVDYEGKVQPRFEFVHEHTGLSDPSKVMINES